MDATPPASGDDTAADDASVSLDALWEEVQHVKAFAAQTHSDVGQLCDRLRSNNKLLGKLLDELSAKRGDEDASPLIAQIAHSIDAIKVPLETLSRIEEQQRAQDQALRQLLEAVAANRLLEAVKSKTVALQSEYDALCGAYESKYRAYVELRAQYAELKEDLESVPDHSDPIGPVKKLHHHKMRDIASPVPAPAKRVVSMPHNVD